MKILLSQHGTSAVASALSGSCASGMNSFSRSLHIAQMYATVNIYWVKYFANNLNWLSWNASHSTLKILLCLFGSQSIDGYSTLTTILVLG